LEGKGVASTPAIFVAEFIGTFILTFIGAGSILQSTAMGAGGFGLLGIALAHGLALSIAISATGAISAATSIPP
jgi:aquaporin Z